ncbi:restriction endonuclease subunit S [Duganella sp. Root198D2]|uniref:restriction endonuclease subunit S n=1 Tax=Duganella sp. Root198D2 TaxID=1736489 RepID=UPI0007108BF9|nr:restriction endonuclease subunit S [Duganella sp. Root198D2]KRB97278.1 hypothetical protein ASE26_04435 [Duganella sp. Root198D2]
MEIPRIPLANLILEGRQKRIAPTNSQVWNLNLDQIESGSGRVLERIMTTVDELGPSTYAFEAGTVLYSKLRPYLNKVVVADSDGFATTELVPLRGDPEKVYAPYLAYYLRSAEFLNFANTVVAGAKMPRMVMSEFWRYEAPLPPISEQHRIAAILDKADALRAKRREALAQLDCLAQSIFVEMFGDPVTNPKRWAEIEMAALFETSPIFGTMIPPTPDGGNWLSLRVANIQDWRLDLSDQKYVNLPPNTIERHSVKDGDLLLARAIASQEHLGKAVVATPAGRKWAFDSHLMRLRFNPERASPEFVRHLWMTPGGRSLFLKATRRTAVQYNINTKEMNSLRLPIPPIELQRKFVCRVEALNSLRDRQLEALKRMDALFSVLQHRAFRGELKGSNVPEFVRHENDELRTN